MQGFYRQGLCVWNLPEVAPGSIYPSIYEGGSFGFYPNSFIGGAITSPLMRFRHAGGTGLVLKLNENGKPFTAIIWSTFQESSKEFIYYASENYVCERAKAAQTFWEQMEVFSSCECTSHKIQNSMFTWVIQLLQGTHPTIKLEGEIEQNPFSSLPADKENPQKPLLKAPQIPVASPPTILQQIKAIASIFFYGSGYC